jgi:pimeloyl-ACP methyl ester carboxylesterase
MLHYEIIGKGYPIVFLHGFLESTKMWKPLHLDKQPFRSILIDLPGHGKSALNNIEPDLRKYALEVFNVLELEGIFEFGLVGHSMGGYVALEMAKHNSDIEKLVLLNSCFWQDSPTKQKERQRVLQILEKNKSRYLLEAIPGMFVNPSEHQLFIKESVSDAKQMSLDAILTATKAMMNRSSSEGIADCLGSNLKIIQGELDTSVSLKMMLEKTVKKPYNLSVLQNVGHMSHKEATEDVLQLILEFFKF